MKVCILTSSYPRFEGDYAGIFVAGLAQELAGRGIELWVLAPRAPGLEELEVCKGVRIIRFAYFWPRRLEVLAYGSGISSNLKANPLLYFLLPFFFAGEVRALRRCVRAEKIRVVNAHWMVAQGLAAAWIARRGQARFVLTIHGAGLHALARHPLGRIVARWIVRWADHIFCASSSLKLLLERLVGSETPAEVLPLGISLSQFDPADWSVKAARTSFGVGGEKVVVFLGRLQEVKGVRTLIEAMRILTDLSGETISLLIGGDGLERPSLERLVTRHRLQDRVRFLGAISHNEAPAFLAAADVVCVPSIVEKRGVMEGLGMVLLEAMALGKVVVASRIGGIPDLIQDGINGFLTEPGDPRALAEKLAWVLALGEKAGSVGLEAHRAAEKFGWETVAERYAQVFHAVLQGK